LFPWFAKLSLSTLRIYVLFEIITTGAVESPGFSMLLSTQIETHVDSETMCT